MMMDTTTTSTLGGGDEVNRNRYVSCIKVDGVPILPPLMTEERRAEMRRYKELAILKEKQLTQNKTTLKHTGRSKENTEINTRKVRSASTSPGPGDPITSTPRVARIESKFVDGACKEQSAGNQNFMNNMLTNPPPPSTLGFGSVNSDIPETVLRERKIHVIPLDLNKTTSSDPSGRSSSSAMSYDGDNRKAEMGAESDGEENFASATSSTGTFIIRRSEEVDNRNNSISSRKSRESMYTTHTVVTSEDEGENAPPTVVRKPQEEPIFSRRKRPAKFFDDDEGDGTATDLSKTGSSTGYLPNSVPEDDNVENVAKPNIKMSFSPVPYTNFTSIAKSITKEFTQKVCATLSSSSFTSSRPRVSGGSVGSVRISGSIGKGDSPLSAEKYIKDIDTVSNSSDKENINTLDSDNSRKHVRKLSYTLDTPSAVLLESVSKERKFIQALDTVPSVPSSVGFQSAQPTPEKSQLQQSRSLSDDCKPKSLNFSEMPPPLFKDIPKSNDPGLTSALANLNLGQGKQAHLERFLGDQDQNPNKTLPQSATAVEDDQVRSILIHMQEEQFKRLQELADQHRQQELLLRQQFESEIEKLREKLSSTLNSTNSSKSSKTSPNSVLDSVNSSARSPRLQTATSATGRGSTMLSPEEITQHTDTSNKGVTSGMSGISFSDQTKSGVGMSTSVYQFKGGEGPSGQTKARTGAGGMATTNDLTGVGLSKLQSRMHLMSPSLFRVPMDGKSPLLKGLVFPDPLDKPRPPVKIPPKALDAEMKPKFDKISAAVKGFLTRRVLNTEKVQIIVQTIRDTVDLLMKLYEEAPMNENTAVVKPQDHELHQRLIQQLTGACRSFHDVFFKLTTKERMAIIATDREKLKAKALRLMSSPGKPAISTATLKSIERRMSHRSSPMRETRRQRNSKAYDPTLLGSMSAKPKTIKSFNISPKRRRISYWDEKNYSNRHSNIFDKQDPNGNNSDLKTPVNSGRSVTSVSSSSKSLRSYQLGSSGGIGDTFIIPSSVPPKSATSGSSTYNSARSSNSGRRASTSSKGMNMNSRSGQTTVAATSTFTRSSGRASLSRQSKPWK